MTMVWSVTALNADLCCCHRESGKVTPPTQYMYIVEHDCAMYMHEKEKRHTPTISLDTNTPVLLAAFVMV